MSDFSSSILPKPLAVDSKTAAALLSSTTASLEKDRLTGHMGVPYVKAGRRVVYSLSDLGEWLKANRIVPLQSMEPERTPRTQGGA